MGVSRRYSFLNLSYNINYFRRKNNIKYLDLIIGIACILYYSYIKFFYNGMVFDNFFIIVGIILIIYNLIKKKKTVNNKFKKFIKITFSIIIFTIIILESIIVIFPKKNIKNDCDYLIILGASVKNSGPSLTLRSRLDKAITYINESNDKCYVVVSGGKGNDEKLSEAKVMQNYLINHNISKDKIIMENKSTNTYENFKYSKEKIENHSKKGIKNTKVKVITTDFHSFRSFLLAKKNGYKQVNFYSSNSLIQFIPIYYARESFAIIKTIFFDIVLNK